MKKTLLLFMLFLTIGIAGFAQSMAEHRAALNALAPHKPTVHRWTAGDGKKWHDGVVVQYTQTTQDTAKLWIISYPDEAHDYKHYFEEHFDELVPPVGLSPDDADIYWDLHAIWMMIHANHQHEEE